MKTKISTILNRKPAWLFAILTLLTLNGGWAQTVAKLKFRQPQLIAGVGGQIGATYRFLNVSPLINANINIESIVNGAVLKNIDDSTLGYYDAWQPTVGGQGTFGSSYIKWDIKFDSAGATYVYSVLNASAIDVDGDNVRVREFINVNGQSSYNIPKQIPSLLTITNEKDTNNVNGTDVSDSNLHVLGPVINRTGIDTLSQDVRVNFTFNNQSEFKIYTGSQVDSNGNSGPIATDRYHCIYFMNITGSLSILPVKLQFFDGELNNNKKVNLVWSIDGGAQVDHFEIEKSFDQANFSTTGMVLGDLSTINNRTQYSFTDESGEIANQTITYYRLKIIDARGNITYSPVKIIRINATDISNKRFVKVFPNPYMDNITINFNSNQNAPAIIKMINSNGQAIISQQFLVSTGSNNIQLNNLASQLAGIYFIDVLINDTVTMTQTVVKL
ncbi:MAG: T9SS type A sorting domain-containing protein [Bacteroidota bacterium]|nr:T9SS type A sorting domain-containing protein [Bacteroidota bacterium]